jgi:hypothetical protein
MTLNLIPDLFNRFYGDCFLRPRRTAWGGLGRLQLQTSGRP